MYKEYKKLLKKGGKKVDIETQLAQKYGYKIESKNKSIMELIKNGQTMSSREIAELTEKGTRIY